MIPSNELRVGNYVMADQKVQSISMVDNATATTGVVLVNSIPGKADTVASYPLEMLQPVLLSDSVLEQCRFLYHDYFKFWQLIEGEEATRSEMDIDRDYNILDFMRKPIVKKVTSLHQLQNIYFMLKGRELVVHSPTS